MDFLLLGPVELSVEGHTFELQSDKVRCLIAALALEVGKAIAADRLMARMWDDDDARDRARLHEQISRARGQMRKAASAAHRLRSSLRPGPYAAEGSALAYEPPAIRGRSHTYTLETDPATVDRHRFRQLCEDARAAAARGEDARAVELLDIARKLWRGEPLAGLPGLWPERVRVQLDAEYTSATAARSAASLRLGRFESLIGELSDLVQRDPVDEQFAGYLMLACYGSRRHSDVVRVYQGLRRALRTDSGNEPDVAIGRLYQRMVEGRPVGNLVKEFVPGGASSQDADLVSLVSGSAALRGSGSEDVDAARDTVLTQGVGAREEFSITPTGAAEDGGQGTSAVSSGANTVPGASAAARLPDTSSPRMLPRQAALEGRQAELRQLLNFIGTDTGHASTARLAIITGMPGVGKTALAVHAARKVARDYPSGELYINLRGHDGSQAPLRPEAALGILLRGLGVEPNSVPVGVDECAALWHTMLAARRCVIVLDDAESAEQVAPLLLNDSASVVFITSRRYLVNLPDAYLIALEALPPRDGIALFRRLSGEDRSCDVDEVARITRLCGYLPLAIRLAAMRFHTRKTWSLSTLRKRLERGKRLDELRDIETQEGIDRAFSLSYRTLRQAERRAFRLLSLHSGDSFSAEAAAAILNVSVQQAERLLEGLLSSSILQEVAPNRYTTHDLLAEYASLLTQKEDSEAERSQAMARLTAFYIYAAEQADRLVYPNRLEPAVSHRIPPVPLPFEPTVDEARAWFETEREALLHVEEYARLNGAPDQAAVLGQYVAAFLEAECHWKEAKKIASQSAAHWRRVGHTGALCRSLLSLGTVNRQMGDYQEARSTVEEALDLARAHHDRDAEVALLEGLGVLYRYLGENSKSLTLLETALDILPKSGEGRQREAGVENKIAITLLHLEENEKAQGYFQRAIEKFREMNNERDLGRALSNSGNLYMKIGNLEAARRCLNEALPILESVGSKYEIAMARMSFGDLAAECGDIEAAILAYGDAVRSFKAIRDRRGLADAWNGLGELQYKLGRYRESCDCHARALEMAKIIGATHEQIVAYRGLGASEYEEGNQDVAAAHLYAAMALADRTNEPGESAKSRAALTRIWTAGRSVASGPVT